MISACTFRPMPAVYKQPSSIRLRCRDFTFVAFQFEDDQVAKSVYDTIKSLTCLSRIEKVHAFTFKDAAPPMEKKVNGWDMYDARLEFKRMGISSKAKEIGWRVSEINKDYQYSPTYPAILVVPSSITDSTLKHGGVYRSKQRIPALTYLHSVNNCSITRSAQPLVGYFAGKRNPQDERLVAAVFATSRPPAPNAAATSDTASLVAVTSQAHLAESKGVQEDDMASSQDNAAFAIGEDEEEQYALSRSESDIGAAAVPQLPKVYGAQQRNFIVDARPQVNAIANQATGMGSENMEWYPGATKEYLGIANIHAMRDSLNKVFDAFTNTDYTNFAPNQDLLTKSKWLDYITILLRGADLVARQVGINHSHVLIHCSDGWDRTSQISALSQLCLDPYYRTLDGFIVLVEKDFLSFGHMFRHRSGFLGSEKWFQVENERVGGAAEHSNTNTNSGSGGGHAMENSLFAAAKGFFKQKNESKDSLDIDPEDVAPGAPTKGDKHGTKVKETSPIFHQFLEATYQILHQHPDRFEFNERFLRRLLYQLYSCQYGTFLYDSERDRVEARVSERTRSVWDHFLARRDAFTHPNYDPTIDDNIPGKERLLFPDMRKVRWWPELYGRTDTEMNGTATAPAPSLPKESGALREPLVTGIENAEMSVGPAAANGSRTSSPRPNYQNGPGILSNRIEKVSAGLAGMGFGTRNAASRSSPPDGSRPGTPSKRLESEATKVTPPTPAQALGPPKKEDMFSAFARDNAFRDS